MRPVIRWHPFTEVMIMHKFRSTPRLATPGILINQQVVPRD